MMDEEQLLSSLAQITYYSIVAKASGQTEDTTDKYLFNKKECSSTLTQRIDYHVPHVEGQIKSKVAMQKVCRDNIRYRYV